MARTRFLPGFDTAPGPNRALLRKSDFGPIIYGIEDPDSIHKYRAELLLASRRQIVDPLNAIEVNWQPESLSFDSAETGWRIIKDGMQTWLGEQLSGVTIPRYKNQFPTAEAAKAHVIEAGNDGIATDIAFLEVISKVLFRREFQNPNDEIATWARSSVGFIVEWAGLDGEVDLQLAWALSSPKPKTKKELFHDIHFNPGWFTDYESTKHVGLNGDIVGNLRDENNEHPNAARLASYVLFACPAAKIIPQIHMSAVDIAQSSGLFERTWLEERANFGLPEAWVALEGLRAAGD